MAAMQSSQDSRYTVMTVCTGNICRSPMAAIILRERFNERGLADQVAISTRSAATLRRAEELGLGTSYHEKATDAVRDADLVVVLTSATDALIGPD